MTLMALSPAFPSTGVLPATPATIDSAAALVLVLAGLLIAAAVMLAYLPARSAHRLRLAGRDRGAQPGVSGYRTFLKRRDGVADLRRHTLEHREALFAALDAAPLRSATHIDAAAYHRNLRRRRLEPGLDARLLWLLATAKTNQAERFGVGLAEVYGRLHALDDDPVRLHIYLQETYHTRILADVVALFDLPVHPAPPPLCTRMLIKLLVFAPPRPVLPLVGLSEMAGCATFRALRDRGVELFADEPLIAERIRLLYDEILADEISHVGYVTAQLGPFRRALMVAVYRWVGVRLASQLPELTLLFGRSELARQLRAFDLDAMLAEVGDRAYGFNVRPALKAAA